MDVYQHTLEAALFLAQHPMAVRDLQRIIQGAPEFVKLGPIAQVQSVTRSIVYVTRWVEDDMAKNGKTLPRPAASGNINWVNYKPDEGELTHFRSWEYEDDEIASAIVSLIAEGYTFKVSHDNYNKAIQVTCIAPAAVGDNAGKGFSSYASSWSKAWAMCVFKHFTLWQGKWPENSAPLNRSEFG